MAGPRHRRWVQDGELAGVLQHYRHGRAGRSVLMQPGRDIKRVGFLGLPRAPARSVPAPREAAGYVRFVYFYPGREAFHDADKGRTVRLSGGKISEHKFLF